MAFVNFGHFATILTNITGFSGLQFTVLAMDITPRKRQAIVTLSENTSLTQREIANKCGVSQSAVSKIVKLKKTLGSFSPQRIGKCGRKRATTARDDVFLLRQSKIDPTKNSFDLQKDLAARGTQIHDSTVRRRLLEGGRPARRPVKKQLLTEVMKKKRLSWAKKYKHWTKEDWRKVLFSDESHFLVQGVRVQHVRRGVDEKVSPKHVSQFVKHPQKKMFWGCFSFFGPEALVPVEGMMNGDKYLEIVRSRVIPLLQKLYPDNSGIFQQDLAPCHTSKKVKTFFRQNGLKTLDWPGNSPDLNPIENLWSICKGRLRKMDCTTKDKMISALLKIWFRDENFKKQCQTLVDSMPRRVKMVIDNKGGHTKW